jgi:hypothetical protein
MKFVGETAIWKTFGIWNRGLNFEALSSSAFITGEPKGKWRQSE